MIEGAAVGTARAINQQRAAATLRNIVASDEIGNFPDQNAAEAIQRISGISLFRDQGQGRYIVLRGLNYTYTSVKRTAPRSPAPTWASARRRST